MTPARIFGALATLGLAAAAFAPACALSTSADAGCPAGQKACDSRCVDTTDPATGCASPGCAPCAVSHASAACDARGLCAAAACSKGFGDCDGAPATGCETSLFDSAAHCGACGHACASAELCRTGSCLSTEVPRVEAWLATQRGGYCDATFNQLVTLCNNTKYTGTDAEFCFDEALLNLYPDGLALDVGFHWSGGSTGNIAAIGGDCDEKRVTLSIEGGRLLAEGMMGASKLDVPLTPGTHLASYRVDAKTVALFLDGALVAQGLGTGGPTPELITRCGPGIVLGGRISYWWESTIDKPGAWLRFAPFFFHLRDADPAQPATRFDLDAVTSRGARTRLLFDATGAAKDTWTARDGIHKGYARNGATWSPDALACLKQGSP